MKDEQNTSRRDMLKGAGAVAFGVAASLLTLGKSEAAEGGDKRWAMAIDLRKCYGCHSCSVSCKAEFEVPLGSWRSWVKTVERGSYPNVRRNFLPRLCNHCAKPPCVWVCPTKASHIRPDGLVDIHEGMCIGCRNCISVCPYNSRFLNPHKKVAQKCDFCRHRIDKGVEPSCVNTCPASARVFGDINDSKSAISKLLATAATQGLRAELGTDPHVLYIGADNKTMIAYGRGGSHE